MNTKKDSFVIARREEQTVTMTIRIDKDLQEAYNELAYKTNHSRNELIEKALKFALERLEIEDEKK